MGSLFSSPKAPEPIIVPPKGEDPRLAEAARKEAERLRRLRGTASTILTGPQGVTATPPTVTKLGE
jgi:hypothetical protein